MDDDRELSILNDIGNDSDDSEDIPDKKGNKRDSDSILANVKVRPLSHF